jgi:hypothetical protein
VSARTRRLLAALLVAVCAALLAGQHPVSAERHSVGTDSLGVQLTPGQQAFIGAEVDASKRSARGARSLLLLAVVGIASATVLAGINRVPAAGADTRRWALAGPPTSRGPPA